MLAGMRPDARSNMLQATLDDSFGGIGSGHFPVCLTSVLVEPLLLTRCIQVPQLYRTGYCYSLDS
jgi:hypothetical protein